MTGLKTINFRLNCDSRIITGSKMSVAYLWMTNNVTHPSAKCAFSIWKHIPIINITGSSKVIIWISYESHCVRKWYPLYFNKSLMHWRKCPQNFNTVSHFHYIHEHISSKLPPKLGQPSVSLSSQNCISDITTLNAVLKTKMNPKVIHLTTVLTWRRNYIRKKNITI
jgi:hypothetical protein